MVLSVRLLIQCVYFVALVRFWLIGFRYRLYWF